MRAKDVMTSPVVPVLPTATLFDVWQLFSERQISGAPVIDDAGLLRGVISRTDLMREAYSAIEELPNDDYYLGLPTWQKGDTTELGELLKTKAVSAAMNPFVFSVDLNEPVKNLARIMRKNHLHRLIVTGEDQVIGIVTSLDLLKAME